MTCHLDAVTIDRAHARAICQEIGERLKLSLGGEDDGPPRLRRLMDRLANVDAAESA